MQEVLTSLSTYGYILLFLYSLGGGMIGIIAAGVLCYAGKMDLVTSIIVAGVANIIGDTLIFYLTRYSKAQIMPYLKNQRRNLALSQVLFKKYGSIIILIKKYIYGIKTIIPIAIALTKYSFVKFSILNVIASFIWAITLASLSYYMGDAISEIYASFKDRYWLLPTILFTLVAIIVMYFKKTTKKK